MSRSPRKVGKRTLARIEKALNEQYPELADEDDIEFVVESFHIQKKGQKVVAVWTVVSDETGPLQVKFPESETQETSKGKILNILTSVVGPVLVTTLLSRLSSENSDIRLHPFGGRDLDDVFTDADLFSMM